jgi:lipopolysaccharide transport system permease protein
MQDLILESGRTEKNYWQDLWRFRELFYILAWRDLMVRYKQTAIGVAWALLRPGLTMVVFVGFRKVTKMPPTDVPDPIFVLAALLPWMFFSNALSEAASSLIINANLISKVYFPRIIVPAGAAITSLVDFVITLALLAGLMLYYKFSPSWTAMALPLLALLLFALSIGSGLLLASLNVKYRDFRYILPFIVQFGLFISPIAITASDVPETWRPIYCLNPMVGIIDMFRWAICRGTPTVDWFSLTASIFVTVCLLILGVCVFRKTEKEFADII